MTKVSELTLNYNTVSQSFEARWKANIDENKLNGFRVRWLYKITGTSVWNDDGETTVSPQIGHTKDTVYTNSKTFDRMNIDVKVWVVAVPNEYTANNVQVKYFTEEPVQVAKANTIPSNPPTPTVELTEDKLGVNVTVALEAAYNATSMKIQVVKAYKDRPTTGSEIKVQTVNFGTISELYTTNKTVRISLGPDVICKVRVRFLRNGVQSAAWSDVSELIETIPNRVTGLSATFTERTEDTARIIKLTWDKHPVATSYEIRYGTRAIFDLNDYQTATTTNTNYSFSPDLGSRYWIQVRAVNDAGESNWGDEISVKPAVRPSAPTTWSSTQTVRKGDKVYLYWLHNCSDSSKETRAEVFVKTATTAGRTYTVHNTKTQEEYDKNPTSVYVLNTSSYTEDIIWSVRTAGLLVETDLSPAYGEYSIERTINLHETPALYASFYSLAEMDGFPYRFDIDRYTPSNLDVVVQTVRIQALEGYLGVNFNGEEEYVYEGQELFARSFNSYTKTVDVYPTDCRLMPGVTYEASIELTLSSGLTGEYTYQFTHIEETDDFYVDAGVEINSDDYSAVITPHCYDENGMDITEEYGGYTLSVYRREVDGSFTLVANNITTGNYMVVDPHPALDYARYRIVGVYNVTGDLRYVDLPGIPMPIGENDDGLSNSKSGIVIQWNDRSRVIIDPASDGTYDEEPLTSSSILFLPYNVDITEDHEVDATMVNYIGRKYPVSYYGTKRRHSATWSASVPRRDEETIAQLRRLADWDGDVYVREQSGAGYWAHVSVSLSITHMEPVVPVTLTVTRVEGGL